jgi:uncharacterized protein (TIGR02453 family)
VSITGLADFLTGLTANNNKEWFEAHRSEYTALRGEFTEFVADVIAQTAAFDPSIANVVAKDALFRINRDLRFSRDKQPYKTTFSAAFGSSGRHGGGPGYYLQIDAAGQLHQGAGLHEPEPAALGRVRDRIVAAPDEFAAVVQSADFLREFGRLEGPRLKRLPAGLPADAPFPDELKLTSFGVGKTFDARGLTWEDLATSVATNFRQMQPLVSWLRRASE